MFRHFWIEKSGELLLLLLLLLLLFVVPCHRPFLCNDSPLDPPLRLQVSDCSTFLVMCEVPSVAVVCSESIECFLVWFPKFFFNTFVALSVAPLITDIIVHFASQIILCCSDFCVSFFVTFLPAFIVNFIICILSVFCY